MVINHALDTAVGWMPSRVTMSLVPQTIAQPKGEFGQPSPKGLYSKAPWPFHGSIPALTPDQRTMDKQKHMPSSVFKSIVEGLEQAIAFQRGEYVGTYRIHHFEHLPDGTVRKAGVKEVTGKGKGETR
jgi:hypothetical protein